MDESPKGKKTGNENKRNEMIVARFFHTTR